jgi:hypothetical protein
MSRGRDLSGFDRLNPLPVLIGEARYAGARLQIVPNGLQAFPRGIPSVAKYLHKGALTSTDSPRTAYKSSSDVGRTVRLACEIAKDRGKPAAVLSAARIKRE